MSITSGPIFEGFEWVKILQINYGKYLIGVRTVKILQRMLKKSFSNSELLDMCCSSCIRGRVSYLLVASVGILQPYASLKGVDQIRESK